MRAALADAERGSPKRVDFCKQTWPAIADLDPDMASVSVASPAPAPVVSLLSTGCNRAATALVWLARTDARWFPEGLVAYAAGRNIAIYDPHLQTIVAILRGHSARVNALQWITRTNDEAGEQSTFSLLQLATGSADKQLLIWHYDPATRHYAVQARLSGHEDGISAVAAIALPRSAPDSKQLALVASTSTDLTTRIWIREMDEAADTAAFAAASLRDASEPAAAPESGGWRCTQILPSGRHKIMHCLSLVYVPLPARSALPSLLMLAVGGVDSRIHLWMAGVTAAAAASSDALHFLPATSLEGHENWITSLDWAKMDPEPVADASSSASSAAPLVSLMLASASQDKRIRLWKLQISAPVGADSSVACVTSTSLGSRGHILAFAGLSIFVVLESVLLGHENWVMSARWQPPYMRRSSATDAALERHQPMCLLSASTDKSMLLWRPTSGPEGLWTHEVRVGDMGGHTLGFYGCAFHPAGTAILSNGYSGSLHLWREDTQSASGRWLPAVTVSGHAGPVNDMTWDAQADYLLTTSSDQTTRLFAPWISHRIPTVGGAAAASSSSSAVGSRPTWHEISRPQLHGYDLNCLAPLYDPTHTRAHALASGADEKVLRVFWAPTPFLQTLKQIAGVDTIEASAGAASERPKEAAVMVDENKIGAGGDEDEDGGGAMEERKSSPAPPAAASAVSKSSVIGPNAEQLAFLEQSSARALKANLPELGLSNKALREGEAANTLRGMQHVQQAVSSSTDRSASIPPPEDYLLTSTLWPEIEKLYGHGFEIVSLSCSFDGALLASACTAKKTQHAVVRVWDTKSWSERFVLESHRATVVQMAFSPSDKYLLTASRDRHVSLFQFAREGGAASAASDAAPIVHVGTTKTKAHARIIWSVSWLPVLDAHWFVTGSRDKSVKLFRATAAGAAEEDSTLPVFAQSVTAVAFAPLAPSSPASGILFPRAAALRPSTKVTVAVGMEDGRIELWQATIHLRSDEAAKEKTQWTKLYAFESKFESTTHGRQARGGVRVVDRASDSVFVVCSCCAACALAVQSRDCAGDGGLRTRKRPAPPILLLSWIWRCAAKTNPCASSLSARPPLTPRQPPLRASRHPFSSASSLHLFTQEINPSFFNHSAPRFSLSSIACESLWSSAGQASAPAIVRVHGPDSEHARRSPVLYMCSTATTLHIPVHALNSAPVLHADIDESRRRPFAPLPVLLPSPTVDSSAPFDSATLMKRPDRFNSSHRTSPHLPRHRCALSAPDFGAHLPPRKMSSSTKQRAPAAAASSSSSRGLSPVISSLSPPALAGVSPSDAVELADLQKRGESRLLLNASSRRR